MATDLGSAIRNLRRAPAFTGLVVLTLALGIGASTAMFSVVDSVLLHPLPFPNAARLSELWAVTAPQGTRRPGGSIAIVQALRQHPDLFAAVEAYQFGSADLTGGGDPEIVASSQLSPGMMAMLGATPKLGRLFVEDDAVAGNVVILSERLWVGRYGSDPTIVGREITVDDRPHRVLGVMPRDFRFPENNARMWRPLDVSSTAKPLRVQVVTMRRADITEAQVNDRLRALSPALRESAVLPTDQTLTTGLLLQQRLGSQSGEALYTMFAAVLLVLLVACVNVTNLLLVRSSTRTAELALMTALGASRANLVRAVLAESAVLAVAGWGAGLLLARALLELILGLAPPQLTFLTSATTELDWRALVFAGGLASATCFLVGVLPAWRTARVDAIDALKRRSQSVIGSRDDWWQSTLVATQLALVLVLLVGSGLLLRSFVRLVDVDAGYDVDQLSVLELQPPAHRYGAPGAALAFMQELERRIETTPGVKVAITGGAPPSAGGFSFNIKPEAEGGLPVDFTNITLPYSRVAADYFDVMGVRMLRGRSFEAGDPAGVVIVNDLLARRFWGNESPIGRQFRMDTNQPWTTVVGVAADIKLMGPGDPMGEGMEFYQPFLPTGRNGFFALVVRSASNHASVLQMAKQRVWELDPKLPVVEAATMDERIGETIARPRFYLNLASAFAVTAALLGAIGVYGVSAYWVSRRKRELAIRVALGASREQLMAMVVRRGVRIAAAGCAAGLGLAVWGSQAIESMLFQTDARDPLTLISVTVVLGLLALIACALPARAASRVDPMSVLRAE